MKGKMKLSAARGILWALVGLMVVAVVIGLFTGNLSLWIWNALVLCVVYTVVKLLFWRCPHCGRLLGDLRQHSEYCYYCEEKIE